MIIILMGYMGSGKSTIGKELAHILDYNHLDLDEYIEIKEEKTISEVFNKRGEIYFRKQERFYLQQVLDSVSNSVVSLGGGTPCYGDNLSLILKSSKTVSFYLKASIPELVKRLLNEKHKRPVISHLKNTEQLTEFIGKHLFERNTYYAQSNYTIITDGLETKQIAETIITKLIL